ncbi:MAG: glycosyltransferase [Pseudobacter sp.]|uniref:glycosyltransferase n=1 Tax=Pseudobacter sp. TaxID=2045420 RepID=UPI003F812C5E
MKVLLISPSEISYNPRLLKAADFLHGKGAEVTVYNTLTGLTTKEIQEGVKGSRKWRLVEVDISKRSQGSRFNWLYSSLVSRFGFEMFKRFRSRLFFKHVLNKGYVLFPSALKNEKFDYIIIHLVDTLPLAVEIKKKTGARIVYDSQEYFVGQYHFSSVVARDWVIAAEAAYAKDIDIVIATTNVMREKLKEDFRKDDRDVIRVRNTPSKHNVDGTAQEDKTLRIVWHGLTIVPENIRGLQTVVKAISFCKTPVHLYIQGNITPARLEQMNTILKDLKISDKVTILKPADPDHIIASLIRYDVGATGELDGQMNQRLTSSNKMFDSINAGLAVVVPDLPGHVETIREFNVGLIYETGNSEDMAKKLDELNTDRALLGQFKQAAKKARDKELYWEYDYEPVWDSMIRKKTGN